MSSSSASGGELDNDTVLVILLGTVALGGLGGAGALFGLGTDWLVEHSVLIAASASPLLPIPGLDGAGLDLTRSVIAAGLLIMLLAVAGSAIRRFAPHQEDR